MVKIPKPARHAKRCEQCLLIRSARSHHRCTKNAELLFAIESAEKKGERALKRCRYCGKRGKISKRDH